MSSDENRDPTVIESTREKLRQAEPRKPGQAYFSRTLLNFWLDACLLMLFVCLLWISAVLHFAFPAKADASGWSLWGMDIVDWMNLQFSVVCLFAVAVAVHVMLHWSWICGVLNQRIFRRTLIPMNGVDTLIGVGLLLGIFHVLGAGLLLAWYCIQGPE